MTLRRAVGVIFSCISLALPLALAGCHSSDDGSANGGGPLPQFGPPVPTAVSMGPYAKFAYGDFDGDGKIDLVIVESDTMARILLGNGDGSFRSPSSIVGLGTVWMASVGDMNGDGRLDLVVSGCEPASCQGNPSSLFMLIGNGNGTFQPPVRLSTLDAVYGQVIGDFNGDGHTDVGALYSTPALGPLNPAQSHLMILFGNGDNSPMVPADIVTGLDNVDTLVAVDFNRDGKQDLVAHSQNIYNGGNYYSLLSRGDGGFDLAGGLVAVNARQAPKKFVLADLDGDGKADLILGEGGLYPSPLQTLLGKGDGTFGSPRSFDDPRNDYETTFAVGDIDGDGIPDIVVRWTETSVLSLFYGKGDGSFRAVEDLQISPTGRIVDLVDLNGDGRPDLVLATPVGVAVLLNTR